MYVWSGGFQINKMVSKSVVELNLYQDYALIKHLSLLRRCLGLSSTTWRFDGRWWTKKGLPCVHLRETTRIKRSRFLWQILFYQFGLATKVSITNPLYLFGPASKLGRDTSAKTYMWGHLTVKEDGVEDVDMMSSFAHSGKRKNQYSEWDWHWIDSRMRAVDGKLRHYL